MYPLELSLWAAPLLLYERFIDRFEALRDWGNPQILSSLQQVAMMMDAESLDAAPLLDIAPVNTSES